MEVRIPFHKIQEIIERVDNFLQRDKVTFCEMQRLIGVLNFACRAIVPGRPFCRRPINATCGLTKPFHLLRFFMTGSGFPLRMSSCLQIVQQGKVWVLAFTLQVHGRVPNGQMIDMLQGIQTTSQFWNYFLLW